MKITSVAFSNKSRVTNLPGKDVSLDGILNFSENGFEDGPGI